MGTASDADQQKMPGPAIVAWRQRAQLDRPALSGLTGVSELDIAGIERGMREPGRSEFLRIARALEAPVTEIVPVINRLEFRRTYREYAASEKFIDQSEAFVAHLLRGYDPHFAMVLNRHFEVVMINPAMAVLTDFLGEDWLDPEARINYVQSYFDPRRLRQYVKNWQPIGAHLLKECRLHNAQIDDPRLGALIDEVLTYPDVPAAWRDPDFLPETYVDQAVEFVVHDLTVRFFSARTYVLTPHAMAPVDLMVEGFFPADEDSQRFLEAFDLSW